MLETTIEAEAHADSVRFAVRVANTGDDDAELSFSDSQRVRVSVYPADGGGDPEWRSDAGQMFGQVLGSETVPAGEEVVFEEVWDDPAPGTYRAVGEIVCQGDELRAETTFSV